MYGREFDKVLVIVAQAVKFSQFFTTKTIIKSSIENKKRERERREAE